MAIRFINLGDGHFINIDYIQRLSENNDGTITVYVVNPQSALVDGFRVPKDRAWAVIDVLLGMAGPQESDFREAPTR